MAKMHQKQTREAESMAILAREIALEQAKNAELASKMAMEAAQSSK